LPLLIGGDADLDAVAVDVGTLLAEAHEHHDRPDRRRGGVPYEFTLLERDGRRFGR
jgi:hypothetical protein